MNTAYEYVSRAGAKLAHAIETFNLDVNDLRCADFGCNVGGFTDCLLQRGAREVIAIDTGYGVLEWKLRNNPKVEVRERTNALHATRPETGMNLVVIDVGWTPQHRILPIALSWLAEGGSIISLVKPHYELDEAQKREHLKNGRLDETIAASMLEKVIASIPTMHGKVLGHVQSPIRGDKSSRGSRSGNVEFLIHVMPDSAG